MNNFIFYKASGQSYVKKVKRQIFGDGGGSWKLSNDRKIMFWEEQWFGNCSMTINFWGIYSIINEHGVTICEAWDGVNLKFTSTFQRTLNKDIMNQWQELCRLLAVSNCLMKRLSLYSLHSL
jgi:hypothetical protein